MNLPQFQAHQAHTSKLCAWAPPAAQASTKMDFARYMLQIPGHKQLCAALFLKPSARRTPRSPLRELHPLHTRERNIEFAWRVIQTSWLSAIRIFRWHCLGIVRGNVFIIEVSIHK